MSAHPPLLCPPGRGRRHQLSRNYLSKLQNNRVMERAPLPSSPSAHLATPADQTMAESERPRPHRLSGRECKMEGGGGERKTGPC
eukprot:scaffold169688_cov29-Tisochrysis_lutea.AAC.2